MVGNKRGIKATKLRLPDAIPTESMGRFLDDGLTPSCWDRVKVPQTKNVPESIDLAYVFLQKKGVNPGQKHCFVETGANLNVELRRGRRKPLPEGHKVRNRRTLHDPASSDHDVV